MSEESSNKLLLKCPDCGHQVRAPEELLGRETSCVKCGARFKVGRETARWADPRALRGSRRREEEPRPWPPVVRMLLEKGLVTEEQVHQAEKLQAECGGRIYEVLITMGHLDKAAFSELMSRVPGVASIDLKHYQIDQGLVNLMPRELAQHHLAVPIDRLGKLLTVAMACPIETETIDEIQERTGLRVRPMLCSLDDIYFTLDRYFPANGGHSDEEADFSWLSGIGAGGASTGEASAPTAVPPETTLAPDPGAGRSQGPSETHAAEDQAAARPVTGAGTAVSRSAGRTGRPREREAVATDLGRLTAFPPLPETVERARHAAQDPHYPVRDLAVICGTDPPLVARILSVANSAAYGMPSQVDNANLAATLLGTAGLVRVIDYCADAPGPDAKAGFDTARFALRSRYCAAAAQALARASGRAPDSAAMTAGLLHGLGMLGLATARPDAWRRVAGMPYGQERLEAEYGAFGMVYAEAGAVLGRVWRFPERLIDALRRQADVPAAAAAGGLCAVLATAVRMADDFVSAGSASERALDGCEPVIEAMRMEPSAVLAVHQNTAAMFQH